MNRTLDLERSVAGTEDPPSARRRKIRLGAVGAAVGAAAAAWALVEPVGGIDLRAPAFDGSADGFDIGLAAVVTTSAVAAFAAWILLAAVERWARRPRLVWTVFAVAGFVMSLSGPTSGTGIPPSHRFLLALLHVTVAAVLFPPMYRSTAVRNQRRSRS